MREDSQANRGLIRARQGDVDRRAPEGTRGPRDFAPGTWQVFTQFTVEGQPTPQMARESGLTENAVVQAKFRILKRLRKEAGELLE